jgi:hypothetical protein
MNPREKPQNGPQENSEKPSRRRRGESPTEVLTAYTSLPRTEEGPRARSTKHEKKPKPGKTGDKKKWIKTQIAVNSRSIALARLLF